ncbi:MULTISPECIES: sigma factor-like helix-turn-helix DNA-binding protein [Rhodomicrobium]|uniref:RNA polymerase sigma factor n=1 Tax=Rhodomicrobium TaxID=1068 RepID=UPI000B4B65DD|nr:MULTISPECIES: sigma factor-like helix-turn-helix DNA-binding protein [Rhodomicrobium]
MGYIVDQKSQINSELGLMMPRLKSFAAALTGSEAKAQMLLKSTRNHILARMAKERGHTAMTLWAFTQMYKIWVSRMKGGPSDQPEPADPRLFQPRSRMNDGGASARFAMQLAQFAPQQRATLHLVYGERLSYDEVAEIFGVPVAAIITRLSKCHAVLAQPDERERSGFSPAAPSVPAHGRAA